MRMGSSDSLVCASLYHPWCPVVAGMPGSIEASVSMMRDVRLRTSVLDLRTIPVRGVFRRIPEMERWIGAAWR